MYRGFNEYLANNDNVYFYFTKLLGHKALTFPHQRFEAGVHPHTRLA